MNYITVKYKNTIVTMPQQFLIVESSYTMGLIVGNHYWIKNGEHRNDYVDPPQVRQIFDVVMKNGKSIKEHTMFLIPTDLLSIKCVPCTYEQYLKMKAFT